ncbi:hypothetical protein Sgou_20470 [Streptomyces gougerotii]|uniref:Uncharacterized protein n=3 Tax=Streptomyces TaxID=1883 RepID=A0A8H9HSI7_9ACTN|nr:hypothetical protein EES47_07385 [Streptomyces sp. ADI98-12]GFH77377.1 hypothetical protein Sgou_20470 [Streptomyces gougerotii]GGU83515.1 hypothetical protein GCM10010227_42250 [Streptomyces gougerotii]SUP57491.1 Uncharacterised protein [Streptomyces griseus]
MTDRADSDAMPRTAEVPLKWWDRWWWGPALFGSALTLLTLAAGSPLAGRVLDEEFGRVPWWVVVWPLAAGLLLLGGAGAPRSVRWAACLAFVGTPAGIGAYATGAEAQPVPGPFLPAPADERPAAALLAAGLCLAAVGLCVLLHRIAADRVPPAVAGSRIHRARLLTAATAWGVVGGLVLSTGTGYAALAFEAGTRVGPLTFDATSRTVPEEERDEGIEVTHGEHHAPALYGEPAKVVWEKELPGPAALTTCRLSGPPVDEDGGARRPKDNDPVTVRSTLVAVEWGHGWGAVVGHDPADGKERWRYTVRYEGTRGGKDVSHTGGRLGQVGVSDFCTVHVVATANTLVTLDGNSGEVLNEAGLPRGSRRSGGDPRGWSFVTGAAERAGHVGPRQQPPVVRLGRDQHVFLNRGSFVAEIDQATGHLVSMDADQRCDLLTASTVTSADTSLRIPATPHLLTHSCGTPRYTEITAPPSRETWEGRDAKEYDSLQRVPVPASTTLPTLACERDPFVTDFRVSGESYAVAGLWCGSGDDQRKLLLTNAGVREVQVVELPEDTELPLRPVTELTVLGDDYHTVWLSGGSLHALPSETDGKVVHEEGGTRYHAVKPRTLHTGDEPLQAVATFTHPRIHDLERALLVYAVTESGTVLALEQQADPGKVLDRDLTLYAQLPKAAGPCEGTRDLAVDRAGEKLLTWCTTGQRTKATAVGLNSLTTP